MLVFAREVIFVFAMSCSTQSIFYSLVPECVLNVCINFCSFHKTAKTTKLFFLETIHIASYAMWYVNPVIVGAIYTKHLFL